MNKNVHWSLLLAVAKKVQCPLILFRARWNHHNKKEDSHNQERNPLNPIARKIYPLSGVMPASPVRE